jgi:hypothetical protein
VRVHWNQLPDPVREAVRGETGRVHCAVSALDGASSMVAATLDTDAGRVFCKGHRDDQPGSWMLRNEVRVNPHLPATSPSVLWTVQRDGWLLVGFEHISGRHPDLAPGSVDLSTVSDLLTGNAVALTPCRPTVQPLRVRWQHLIEASHVDGDTLLHTDMTPRNFLIGERPSLVDWSSPAVGAAWVDTAFIIPRLVLAGHSPAGAERWAQQVPAYAQAPAQAVTAFVAGLVGLWERRQLDAPAAHRGPLVAAARSWAEHRTRPRLDSSI